MEKTLYFNRRTALCLMLAMASGLALANPQRPHGENRRKGLIVYYSWSNNTRAMANVIQGHTRFDIEELELMTPYVQNYEELLEQVRDEERRGYLPPLKSLRSDLSSYDVILVGSPLWIGSLSSPMMSFLQNHDLSDKIVIPFATRGTSLPERLYAKFSELCPHSHEMPGFDITRGEFNKAQPALLVWLDDTMSQLQEVPSR